MLIIKPMQNKNKLNKYIILGIYTEKLEPRPDGLPYDFFFQHLSNSYTNTLKLLFNISQKSPQTIG